jgi:hypothetical protein
MQESVPACLRKGVTLFGPNAMGILDDAIREHLELIRRHGAAENDVQRLEDEAFGQSTRPDEADFPDSEGGEAASGNGNGIATEAPPATEPESEEEAAAHEDVTRMLPAEERSPEGEIATGEPDAGTEPEEVAAEADEEDAPLTDTEDHEPVATVHPIVEAPPESEEGEPQPEDTVAEVEEPLVAPEEELAEPAEASGGQEEVTRLYDQDTGEALDFEDLDLQLDDEPPAAQPEPVAAEPELPAAEPEPPSEEFAEEQPAGAIPLEPPIESMDTVEHPFPEEIIEPERDFAPEEPEPEPGEEGEEGEPPATVAAEDEEEVDEEEGEDVLADTPEFLKDAPEDDELWFEQGKPKDFDF